MNIHPADSGSLMCTERATGRNCGDLRKRLQTNHAFFLPLADKLKRSPCLFARSKSEADCSEDTVIRTLVKLQQIPTLHSYKLANVLQVLGHEESEKK